MDEQNEIAEFPGRALVLLVIFLILIVAVIAMGVS
jgi:hypothetical protein